MWHIGAGANPEGGKGLISVKGTIKMVLRYDPDPIRDDNGNIIEPVDPNDKPNKPVYIRVKISPFITAQDGYYPQTNNPGKEHVKFSAEAIGDSQSISQNSQFGRKAIDGSRTFFLKFDPGDGGEVDQWGRTRYLIPLINITEAEAKLDGDRETFHSDWDVDYQNEWNKGELRVDIAVEGECTP